MTNYIWTENTRPDRPGIWMKRGSRHPWTVTEGDISDKGCAFGDWAYVCDLPTIVDPPRYRTPTAADVGREIEVEGVGDCYFVGFSRCGWVVYEYNPKHGMCLYSASPENCRILDDGEPKQPREPREFYVREEAVNPNLHCAYVKPPGFENVPLVHVREVIE